jgi:hypothetical protein
VIENPGDMKSNWVGDGIAVAGHCRRRALPSPGIAVAGHCRRRALPSPGIAVAYSPGVA